MENNRFALIHYTSEQGTLQFHSTDTELRDAGIHCFKSKQPIDPSYLGKNLIAFEKKISKNTDPPTQNERFEEYFLNEFRKNSNAKKIISELFEVKAVNVSVKNAIFKENIDTEVHARDFIHNLRRKNGSFHPKYSIILNTLNFPESYMTHTVTLTDDENSWFSFSF